MRQECLGSRGHDLRPISKAGMALEYMGCEQSQKGRITLNPRWPPAIKLVYIRTEIARAHMVRAKQNLPARPVDAPKRRIRLGLRHHCLAIKVRVPGLSIQPEARPVTPPHRPLFPLGFNGHWKHQARTGG